MPAEIIQPKLYEKLHELCFEALGIDISKPEAQGKIEAYDEAILTDKKIVERIKRLLASYNKLTKQHIKLRFYQVLAIYYTEYFLDNWKHDPLKSLWKKKKKGKDEFLNALAYWMATGSGKTHIMHLNILQMLERNKNFSQYEIIFTTPGVDLIDQHEKDLKPLFEALNRQYKNKINFIIDTTQTLVNKPDDFFNAPVKKGVYRLILVDEAHIGLSSSQKDEEGQFKQLRSRLNKGNSFLFEYSATFHNIGDDEMRGEYENTIVYDYNYDLFFHDGYGKDFWFKEVTQDEIADEEEKYDDNLKENFETIEDKLQCWKDYHSQIRTNNSGSQPLLKPLIAFMGNTVNENKEDDEGSYSDIGKVIDYLARLTDAQKIKFKETFNNQYSGKLILTRNPAADDEILLSYGNKEKYFGIVNVGNGLKFMNDFEHDKIIKSTGSKSIISKSNYFENIDDTTSSINVLIGSRKFAQGWNCYRLAVIGLINLGKSPGNMIIQIFGRGVRLYGLKNDGKRKTIGHNEDYFTLKFKATDNDKEKEAKALRKLETLVVMSLKPSYLKTFTTRILEETKFENSFAIRVEKNIIKLSDSTTIKFEEYKSKLPVQRISKKQIGYKRIYISPDAKISYEFFDKGKKETGELKNFKIALDYRPDKVQGGQEEILSDLKSFSENYSEFISKQSQKLFIHEYQADNQVEVYVKEIAGLRHPEMKDIFPFVSSVIYKKKIEAHELDEIENANDKLYSDFTKKLHERVRRIINQSTYQFDLPLEQANEDNQNGDFIYEYTVIKSYNAEAERKEDLKNEKKVIEEIKEQLKFNFTDSHVYTPLLRDDESQFRVYPDALNGGEKKFMQDISDYVRHNHKKFKDYEVYLMRNVESLKRIGIFLEGEEAVFYPDFVLWMLHKKEDLIYVTFVDPKGQTGIVDQTTLDNNEKIKIADKINCDILPVIEKELSKAHKKKVIVNSFILLRDRKDRKTELGYAMSLDWTKENMISKNVLRLNWAENNEKGIGIDPKELPEGKKYLDWMMDKIK
jgi:hypothetical protein